MFSIFGLQWGIPVESFERYVRLACVESSIVGVANLNSFLRSNARRDVFYLDRKSSSNFRIVLQIRSFCVRSWSTSNNSSILRVWLRLFLSSTWTDPSSYQLGRIVDLVICSKIILVRKRWCWNFSKKFLRAIPSSSSGLGAFGALFRLPKTISRCGWDETSKPLNTEKMLINN